MSKGRLNFDWLAHDIQQLLVMLAECTSWQSLRLKLTRTGNCDYKVLSSSELEGQL